MCLRSFDARVKEPFSSTSRNLESLNTVAYSLLSFSPHIFLGLSLSERSYKDCVLSKFFVFHLLWLSVMQLRHYLFIGTLNPMLQRLTQGEPSLG